MRKKVFLLILIIFLIIIAVSIFGGEKELVDINENIEIVIDPGHGGKDPGTISIDGRHEKEVNLEIAEKLYKELQLKGYGAYLTRDEDIHLENMDRVYIANKNHAKLFISIHCNATEHDRSVEGLQVLYFPSNTSQKFATIMQDSILEEVNMPDMGIVERGDLIVLNQTDMPAVIVEAGFLSNHSESKKLQKTSYQNKIVKGIIKGIQEYYDSQGW